MMQLPFTITNELQITDCKLVANMRFRVKFKFNNTEAEAIYAWGNSRYTTLAVQTSITENVLKTIDEAVEENHKAIGEFLKVQEKNCNTSMS